MPPRFNASFRTRLKGPALTSGARSSGQEHVAGQKDPWYRDKSQSTLWRENKPAANRLHPTMKPVELIERALVNSSKSGDCEAGSVRRIWIDADSVRAPGPQRFPHGTGSAVRRRDRAPLSGLLWQGSKRKPVDLNMVSVLAGIQCSHVEIVAALDVSIDTLYRDHDFAKTYMNGRENGKKSLRRAQYSSAMKGNAQMQIWFGKQYLRQIGHPSHPAPFAPRHTGRRAGDAGQGGARGRHDPPAPHRSRTKRCSRC